MAEKNKPPQKVRRPAPGPGKRYFLATMDEKLIKNLKLAAIKEDKSASQCLEEAAQRWLDQQDPKAARK